MILPAKHIGVAESLFGLGGFILSIMDTPMTLDNIWKEYSKVNNTKKFPAYHGFDNVVLAVNYLYCIGAVDYDQVGKLYNANNRTNSK